MSEAFVCCIRGNINANLFAKDHEQNCIEATRIANVKNEMKLSWCRCFHHLLYGHKTGK